jgi:hypothetical protein
VYRNYRFQPWSTAAIARQQTAEVDAMMIELVTIMYTTWQNNYSHIEEFAKYARE